MRSKKNWNAVMLLLLLLIFQNMGIAQQTSRPNVLFIAVDDLNDSIGPLGGFKINNPSF